MNKTRFEQMLKHQSSIARKVFDAVPISEAWGFQAIQSELFRLGINKPKNIVEACLGSLTDAGLIRKGSQGHYIRICIHEPTAPAPEIKIVPAISTPAPEKLQAEQTPMTEAAQQKTPIQRLEELAAKVSKMAEEILELPSEIESIAAQLKHDAEANAGELAKLNQLKVLLKGL